MSEKRSLLYVVNSLEVGGAEVGLCRLLDGLDWSEYEATVISLDGHTESMLERLPREAAFLDLEIPSLRTLSGLLELVSLARRADVIVGSLFHSAITARLLGLLNSDATVVTWQHSVKFKNDIRTHLLKLSTPLVDTVLADSDPVAEMLAANSHVDNSKVHTVPIAGILLDEYPIRRHIDSDRLVIGSVGRLIEDKGYSTLLDVADELKGTDLRFRIVGDGRLHDELTAERDQRGLDNVSFLGEINDVPEFLSEVDIYVQPSLREGLCITVLEAMAAGLPVVGSDVGGIGRNVTDSETGFLCSPQDVNCFVNAIRRLVENPATRRQFGERGRAFVAENYTQEVLVTEFERALQQASD